MINKVRWVSLGFGVALTVAGVVTPAVAASADTTCYTGCSAPHDPEGQVPVGHDPVAAVQKTVSSGELAFTGGDIEEMTVIGAGALIAGGVFLRRSRRNRITN
jgi:hypothetical protein